MHHFFSENPNGQTQALQSCEYIFYSKNTLNQLLTCVSCQPPDLAVSLSIPYINIQWTYSVSKHVSPEPTNNIYRTYK